jgi:hypothetical protein
MAAAKSCENAQNKNADDGFEHGTRSRRTTAVRLQLMEPFPDWLAYGRASQELVAAAPVVVSAGREELD